MRLVDREQRDARAVDEVEAARHQQPLGRDVEEVELAGGERALDARAARASSDELRYAARTPAWPSAATWSCISAMSGETTTAQPSRSSARHLVAHALAGAGRHQHQRIAARGDVRDDVLLRVAERRVAEHAAERLACASRPGSSAALIEALRRAVSRGTRTAAGGKWWTPVSRVGE
jgi:hypothetical protein